MVMALNTVGLGAVANRVATKVKQDNRVYAFGTPTNVNYENRTIDVVMTTTAMDREREVVETTGIDYKNFLHNPVVLWFHDLQRPPVGKVLEMRVFSDRIEATIQFAKTLLAKDLFDLYSNGDMRAFSIGFIRKKSQPINDKDGNWVGTRIMECELVELSCVTVGMNPEAVSKSLDGETQELIGKAFDNEPEDERVEWQKKAKKYLEGLTEKGNDVDWECPECGHTEKASGDIEKHECPKCQTTMRRRRDRKPKKGMLLSEAVKTFSLSEKALTKSLNERGASGKIPAYIKAVDSDDLPDCELEIEPVQVKDGEIVEAKILGVHVYVKKALEPTVEAPKAVEPPKETGTPDNAEGRTKMVQTDVDGSLRPQPKEDGLHQGADRATEVRMNQKRLCAKLSVFEKKE